MKRVSWILLSLLLGSLTACSDSDTEGGNPAGGDDDTPQTTYSIVWTPQTPSRGEEVVFSIDGPADGVSSVGWNFGDGRFATAAPADRVRHAYGEYGSYQVRAYVSVSGRMSEVSATVVIADTEAEIRVSNPSPARMERVLFSLNRIQQVRSVAWDFGDGSQRQNTTDPTLQMTHQYASEGDYTVSVAILFADGSDKHLTQPVSVSGESLSYSCQHFDKGKVWIMAHRGNFKGGYELPPNSLRGYRKVVEDGFAEFIETDARLTKDGTPIVLHDAHLRTFTNFSDLYPGQTGNVADYTYEEIRQFRLKTTDGTVTDDIVPTLEEVLTELGDKIFFNIDKCGDTNMDVSTLEKVYEVVRKCGCLDRVQFYVGNSGSANAQWLSEQEIPGIIAPHANSQNQVNTMLMYQPYYFIQASTNTLRDNISWLSTVNGKGLSVTNLLDAYWTDFDGGNTAQMDAFVEAGLNMVQCDYPERMHRYLLQKGKR